MSDFEVTWKNNVPVSVNYDDIYYSIEDGLAESRHVFLNGNQIEKRWESWKSPAFQVAELGFGTGLNFLLTVDSYLKSERPFKLCYASIEANPLSVDQLDKALSQFEGDLQLRNELIEKFPDVTRGIHRVEFCEGRVVLDLVFDEVSAGLKSWVGEANAWYFDGFNPKKNPQMWSQDVFELCALKSKNHCTFSTYSSSGQVRRNLEAAGFSVTKVPGFSRKREMSQGSILKSLQRPHTTPMSDVIVIGGGLAGVSAAWAFGKRGVNVSLFERSGNWMQGASGNPVAVFMPRVVRDWVRLSRFSISAFEYFKQHFNSLQDDLSESDYSDCGVLEFEGPDKVFHGREAFAKWNRSDQCSERLGVEIDRSGWFFSSAGWVNPKAWGIRLLAEVENRVQTHFGAGISALRYRRDTGQWYVIGDRGDVLATSSHVVLATANETLRFPLFSWLPIRPVKGQVSLFESDLHFERIFSNRGMIIPVGDRKYYVGSTYDWKNIDLTYDSEDSVSVLKEVLDLPFCDSSIRDLSRWKHLSGRAGLRASTPDKLPLVGKVPNLGIVEPQTDQAWKRYLIENYGEDSDVPGVSLLCAFGSRGLTQALLGAEIIASQLAGESIPLEEDLFRAIAPDRYLKKHLKREWPNAPRTGANQDHRDGSTK